jgi:hypothetical protein
MRRGSILLNGITRCVSPMKISRHPQAKLSNGDDPPLDNRPRLPGCSLHRTGCPDSRGTRFLPEDSCQARGQLSRGRRSPRVIWRVPVGHRLFGTAGAEKPLRERLPGSPVPKAGVQYHCCPPTLAESSAKITLWRFATPTLRGYKALCPPLRPIQENVNRFLRNLVTNLIHSIDSGGEGERRPSPACAACRWFGDGRGLGL